MAVPPPTPNDVPSGFRKLKNDRPCVCFQINATGAAASGRSRSHRFKPSGSVQALASHPLSDTGHHLREIHLLHYFSFNPYSGISPFHILFPPQLPERPSLVFLDEVEKAKLELGTRPSSQVMRTPRQTRRPLTSTPVPRHIP